MYGLSEGALQELDLGGDELVEIERPRIECLLAGESQ
jgi:hypothetical protein